MIDFPIVSYSFMGGAGLSEYSWLGDKVDITWEVLAVETRRGELFSSNREFEGKFISLVNKALKIYLFIIYLVV